VIGFTIYLVTFILIFIYFIINIYFKLYIYIVRYKEMNFFAQYENPCSKKDNYRGKANHARKK